MSAEHEAVEAARRLRRYVGLARKGRMIVGQNFFNTLTRAADMLAALSDRAEGIRAETIEATANDICRDVCELGDRTSPDDQPNMLLVTTEELHAIVTERLRSLSSPGGRE